MTNDFSETDSNGSMMDLEENLKPIGDYLKNRVQMFSEMLRSIRGQKLLAMLPDFLKVFLTSYINIWYLSYCNYIITMIILKIVVHIKLLKKITNGNNFYLICNYLDKIINRFDWF